MRTLLSTLLASLLAAQPALAAFEDLGSGARAPGLGNAFTALADDAYAAYYNPAGLAQLERPHFSAAYAKLYTGLSDGSDLGLSQLAYAHPLKNGRLGTAAGGWSKFGLGDLYDEQTFLISYGRTVLSRESGSRLMLGASAKYLNRSFKRLGEAAAACDQGQCNKGADPVLSGSNSKGTPDVDLGLVYRFPRRFQAGLMVQHLTRPNVGFAGADKLPMNARLGLAYKSLWMSLIGEARLEPAPDGSTDKELIVGAERYFPTLDRGQFGVRGSLGFGSREHRQFTFGASYRINKVQFDYAYLIPVGGFKGADGTHRMALGFHFGAPTAEDEISRELLDRARLLQAGTRGAGYGYEFQEQLRPHDLNDPRLAEVKARIAEGQYRLAHAALDAKVRELPEEASLQRLLKRLEIVAFYYPDLHPVERWERAVASSIERVIQGQDRQALLHASYAYRLNSGDMKLERYLGKLETTLQLKADRLAPDNPRGFIEEYLYRVESANSRRDYARVETLLKDILELEPDNLTALERVGSYYFIIGRHEEALKVWEKALPLETKPAEVESLKQYIRQAREKLGQTGAKLPGDVAAPPPAPPALEPAPVPVEIPPTPQAGDPREIADLYQKGVEHYARGEYLQATALFMRILQIDPANAPARKALERIERQGLRR